MTWRANLAIVLLDVEGEYTRLHEKTANSKMLAALQERELQAAGIPAEHMTVYRLVGRDTSNPEFPKLKEFSLQFARLSPYAAVEILGLSEPQQVRMAFDGQASQPRFWALPQT